MPKKPAPTQVKMTRENAEGVEAVVMAYRDSGLVISANKAANALIAAALKQLEKKGGPKPFCNSFN